MNCPRLAGFKVPIDKVFLQLIPVPSINTQKILIHKIEESLSLHRKMRDKAQVQFEASQRLFKSFLQEIFCDQNTKKWGRSRLGDICTFVGGMQPPKSLFKYTKEKRYIRLIQIQDFRTNEFPVYVPESEGKRRFEKDDVMIGRYGPPLFQILRGLSGAYNVALMKTVPKEGLFKRFLYYLLQEENIQRAVIDQSQRAAGQTGVQKTFLEKYEVKVPSIEEQIKIANKLDDKKNLCDQLINSIKSQSDTIKALPQSILRDAFQGNM
ncbi:restriction endonuclease subunit S [bacterium]|nr:restriction endonuclease subunit S [bacterium]